MGLPQVGDDRRNSEPDENSTELTQSEETGKNTEKKIKVYHMWNCSLGRRMNRAKKKKKEYRLKFSQIWWKTVIRINSN